MSTVFPMRPEDRLWQVKQYQEEQRAQTARERMARAASSEHTTEPSGGRRVGSPGSHRPLVVARQLFRSFTEARRIARFNVDVCTCCTPASASVSPPGSSVFSNGGTLGQLTVHYAAGTQVTVTGTPNEGPCDTLADNVCTVTMNSDRVVTVNP